MALAHAHAVQLRYGTSEPGDLLKNPLKYWLPVDTATSRSNQRGIPPSTWLLHEDHVLHLGGPLDNALLCRFPLRGDFEFGCESLDRESPECHGGIVYGGLQFEPQGRMQWIRVTDTGHTQSVDQDCRHAIRSDPSNFNRLGITSNLQTKNVTLNYQPVWSAPELGNSSPWVGIRGDGRQRSTFRTFELSGKPEVPAEIDLLESSELRGWSASYFAETVPRFKQFGSDDLRLDWFIKDGTLLAPTRSIIKQLPTRQQSFLRYQRPLLDGDSISYEYFYEPNKQNVFPTLGRIAFLIEPDGVQIRWITDGEFEWTGLPENNAISEPLSRRGPRKPPLKEGWNQLTVTIANEQANLTLNGQLIYQRQMDSNDEELGPQTFGLYREPERTAARVRNAKMRGSWSTTLPEDFLANPIVGR